MLGLEGYPLLYMNLLQYLAQKGQQFFEQGISNLPKRWEKIVEQNGKYLSIKITNLGTNLSFHFSRKKCRNLWDQLILSLIENQLATSQLDSDAIPTALSEKFLNASVWTGEIAISQAGIGDRVDLWFPFGFLWLVDIYHANLMVVSFLVSILFLRVVIVAVTASV